MTKNLKKGGSNMPLAETQQKKRPVGSIVGRVYPLELSSRASGNTFLKKSLRPEKAPKRWPFALLFEAFGHQNPPKVDFGTTLKITTN